MLRSAKSLIRAGLRGLQGLGRPQSADTWNKEFSSGKWDFLGDLSEVGRYALISHYVTKLKPEASILDMGCGSGGLRSYFATDAVAHYVGIDVSEEAISQAKQKGFSSAQFFANDFDSLQTTDTFDVLVFNESIYYADNPLRSFKRFWEGLSPGGIIVISIFRFGVRSRAIWRKLESFQRPQYASRLTNEKRLQWDIKVFVKPER
jgi:2-polyprenyl-3-methyl-5-hydroxy-6-metoxy-1,4-benzoquinol methylase